MNFKTELFKILKLSLDNNYTDNYLTQRFGKEKLKKKLYFFKNYLLVYLGLYKNLEKREKELINSFGYLYERLNNKESKVLLLKVLAYRLFGHRKVKLPLNDGNYFNGIKSIEKAIVDKKNYISSDFKNWKLYLHQLDKYGFPAKIYDTNSAVLHQFIERNYEYKKANIMAKKDDIVIDAGGCWGDTAIYFAVKVGKKGKVFSFEFLPENLKILYKNLKLNPLYKKNIKVVQNPLWSKSNLLMSFDNNGPATKILTDKNNKGKKFSTLSLDDFVRNEKIKKINMIKMDIEGSELEALKGAKEILNKFKPQLAISIYHKKNDCKKITQFIESLKLNYKFYFDHHSIHHEESVLFAYAR